jgi:hypothetical protein
MLLSMEELSLFRQKISSYISSFAFPAETEFQNFLDKAISVLEDESDSYRPKSDDKKPGGLLDFSSAEKPVVIVPDIHARAEFLEKLLDFQLPSQEKNVLELLSEQKIFVVCVGDAFHSEIRGAERWQKAFSDWSKGVYAGPHMQDEMKENFSTLQIIIELKNAFTENFHFLKGNHENVMNENSDGNLAFRKFVQEGSMCRDFIRQVYGDAILHLISLWEKALPVCAIFKDFGITHAEPAENFSRSEIVNYRKKDNENVIVGLTWTANDGAEENSVVKISRSLLADSSRKGVIWFGGHRAVMDAAYKLRQNGKYIQFHNPNETNVAVVVPGKEFDPETDIFRL